MSKKQETDSAAVASGTVMARSEGASERRAAARSPAAAGAPGTKAAASPASAKAGARVRSPKAPPAKSARRLPAVALAPATTAMPSIDPAHARHTAIAEAAYLLAHQRGFAPGHELDDWLRAEAAYEARAARD